MENEKKIFVSITTISIPRVVERLEENRRQFDYKGEVVYVITGDVFTPESEVIPYLAEFAEKYNLEYGKDVVYITVSEQIEHLCKYLPGNFCTIQDHNFLDYIPSSSYSMRMVGDYYSYLRGADILVRIDDDNFPVHSSDFFGNHSKTGDMQKVNLVGSASGFYNVCSSLNILPKKEKTVVYPRGFPYEQRHKEVYLDGKAGTSVRVGVCEGLWFGDPDIDAIDRLSVLPYKYTSTFMKATAQIALEKFTWSPINTQNTSVCRDLIPCSMVFPRVGRFDDILGGYLLRAAMDLAGEFYVTYGFPIVNQERNSHDLWDDLLKEIEGYRMINGFVNYLKEFVFKKLDDSEFIESLRMEPRFEIYKKIYLCIADHLETEFLLQDVNRNQNNEYVLEMIKGMRIWANLF